MCHLKYRKISFIKQNGGFLGFLGNLYEVVNFYNESMFIKKARIWSRGKPELQDNKC